MNAMTRNTKSIMVVSVVMLVHTMTSASCPIFTLSYSYDWRGKCIDALGCLLGKRMKFTRISDPHIKQEFLVKRLPQLTSHCQQHLPSLLEVIEKKIDQSLTPSTCNLIVYLTNNWSYGSKRWIILGLRYYLADEVWQANISQEDAFTDLVLHEFLHGWLDDHLDTSSAILQKYAHEETSVKEHIHLMALQKMVYTELKRENMIDFLDHSYRYLAPPGYSRAWEIVNHEGYQEIVDELT